MSAPRQGKLPGPLEGWCRTAAAGEERTVIVRPRYSADIDASVADLGRLGARVQSAGPGAITAVVNPAALKAVADLAWVQAIEEPRVRRPLFSKG
jgi:hypothetical protein